MSTLDYRVSGEPGGTVTLWLHGFLGSGDDWAGISARLPGRNIAPDLPGHGGSVGLAPETYTMEGASEALLEALDETETGQCHVVGYSMGGRLSLYLALRHPARISGVSLESASPGLKTENDRALRRRSDEEKARRLETSDEAEFRSFLSEWHRQPLFKTLANHEGLVDALISERGRNDPVELAKSLRGMGTGSQPSLWEELPDLGVPTLAVVGELDDKFVGIAGEMSERSPLISPTIVPEAGHNVHLEAPDAYLAVLESSLGDG